MRPLVYELGFLKKISCKFKNYPYLCIVDKVINKPN